MWNTASDSPVESIIESSTERGSDRLQYLLLGSVDVRRDGEALDLGVYK
jgi:hypothetical protein